MNNQTDDTTKMDSASTGGGSLPPLDKDDDQTVPEEPIEESVSSPEEQTSGDMDDKELPSFSDKRESVLDEEVEIPEVEKGAEEKGEELTEPPVVGPAPILTAEDSGEGGPPEEDSDEGLKPAREKRKKLKTIAIAAFGLLLLIGVPLLALNLGKFRGDIRQRASGEPLTSDSSVAHLYRFIHEGGENPTYDHIYTTSANERSALDQDPEWREERSEGYLFTSPTIVEGTVGLKRYRHDGVNDHLLIRDGESPPGEGWVDEGVIGYAFPVDQNQPVGTVLLRRFHNRISNKHFYTTNLDDIRDYIEPNLCGGPVMPPCWVEEGTTGYVYSEGGLNKTLGGQVTYKGNNAPAAGIKVVVDNWAGIRKEAVTREDGWWVIPDTGLGDNNCFQVRLEGLAPGVVEATTLNSYGGSTYEAQGYQCVSGNPIQLGQAACGVNCSFEYDPYVPVVGLITDGRTGQTFDVSTEAIKVIVTNGTPVGQAGHKRVEVDVGSDGYFRVPELITRSECYAVQPTGYGGTMAANPPSGVSPNSPNTYEAQGVWCAVGGMTRSNCADQCNFNYTPAAGPTGTPSPTDVPPPTTGTLTIMRAKEVTALNVSCEDLALPTTPNATGTVNVKVTDSTGVVANYDISSGGQPATLVSGDSYTATIDNTNLLPDYTASNVLFCLWNGSIYSGDTDGSISVTGPGSSEQRVLYVGMVKTSGSGGGPAPILRASGRVTDCSSGAGISGVTMRGWVEPECTEGSCPTGVTDSSGNFTITFPAKEGEYWYAVQPGQDTAPSGYQLPIKTTNASAYSRCVSSGTPGLVPEGRPSYECQVWQDDNDCAENGGCNFCFDAVPPASSVVDLVPTHVGVPGLTPPGQGFALSCTAINKGPDSVTDAKVQLLVGEAGYPLVMESFSLVEEFVISGEWAAGESKQVEKQGYSLGTSGTYNALCKVDSDDAISETNENNNLLGMLFSIGFPPPGLNINLKVSVLDTPTEVTEGQGFNISCTGVNEGTDTTRTGVYFMQIELDGEIIKEGAVGNWAPGQTQTLEVSGSNSLSLGTHTVTCRTDPRNYYDESQGELEGDNEVSKEIRVVTASRTTGNLQVWAGEILGTEVSCAALEGVVGSGAVEGISFKVNGPAPINGLSYSTSKTLSDIAVGSYTVTINNANLPTGYIADSYVYCVGGSKSLSAATAAVAAGGTTDVYLGVIKSSPPPATTMASLTIQSIREISATDVACETLRNQPEASSEVRIKINGPHGAEAEGSPYHSYYHNGSLHPVGETIADLIAGEQYSVQVYDYAGQLPIDYVSGSYAYCRNGYGGIIGDQGQAVTITAGDPATDGSGVTNRLDIGLVQAVPVCSLVKVQKNVEGNWVDMVAGDIFAKGAMLRLVVSSNGNSRVTGAKFTITDGSGSVTTKSTTSAEGNDYYLDYTFDSLGVISISATLVY